MLKFLFMQRPTWLAKALLALIVVVSFSMMAYSSNHEAATFDESAHIPAGYSYLRYLDYRLNPEHPPLVKAIAAVPLMFLNLNFPTHLQAWQEDVNGQWVMGGNFFYHSGNDGNLIVRAARYGPMFLTILLAILIYAWSSKLMGKFFALVPTFLFAFSPNVLAHGHYVTTDIGAALGITLSLMTFITFLFQPSRKHLLYAGLAFGVAQLLKFSAVLLIPYLLLLIALFWVFTVRRDWDSTTPSARLRRFFIRGLRYLRSTIVVMALGAVLVIYPVYFAFTANYPLDRQVRDTSSILARFGGGPTPAGQHCGIMRCFAELTIEGASHRVTQPFSQYAVGVLTAFERSEGGNANYFFGKVSGTGTPTYFPTVYLMKEPLPILIALAIAAFVGIKRWRRSKQNVPGKEWVSTLASHKTRFTVFAMLLFIVLYWASSITSPLNIGLRHLFPTFPFMYILIGLAWERWIFKNAGTNRSGSFLENAVSQLQQLPKMFIKTTGLSLLMLWLLMESVVAAPHFLSYFNQIGGGSSEGYRYVTDSNYDWGQDLYDLKIFVDAHPEIDKIAVDYFGGGSPAYTLGDKAEGWWSARGNPTDSGINWFAVSVNSLEGSMQPTKGKYDRKPEDEYRWLSAFRPANNGIGSLPEPDYRAGTSIFIYKLR